MGRRSPRPVSISAASHLMRPPSPMLMAGWLVGNTRARFTFIRAIARDAWWGPAVDARRDPSSGAMNRADATLKEIVVREFLSALGRDAPIANSVANAVPLARW